MKINLLDCTFRDGGYYNNWNFKSKIIKDYLKAMLSANIDYIEIGFRSIKKNNLIGPTGDASDNFIKSLNIPKKIKIGVMVNASEIISYSNGSITAIEKIFVPKKNSPISFVRIACHFHEYSKVFKSCKRLKELGYLVCINIMQCSAIEDKGIVKIGKTIPKDCVDVLYLADSLGGLNPKRLKSLIILIKKYWKKDLGIHTHDNMEKSLINSITAYDNGIRWIDGTVTGMGRGPGNAKIEYLILEFSTIRAKKFNLTKLNNLIEDYFIQLKEKHKWGSNYYYYLAGLYGIHPTYIQIMLSDSKYNKDDITFIIEQLKNKDARNFDPYKLETARFFFTGTPRGTWCPINVLKSKEILIIGAGPSIKSHKELIEDFIIDKKPVVIGLNATSEIDPKYIKIRAACHPVRLLTESHKYIKLKEPLITPYSMLPREVVSALKTKKVYDFGLTVQKGKFIVNNKHCVLPNAQVISYALAVAIAGNARKIYLAGIDGYVYDDSRKKGSDEEIFLLYKLNNISLSIYSITPTSYDIDNYWTNK